MVFQRLSASFGAGTITSQTPGGVLHGICSQSRLGSMYTVAAGSIDVFRCEISTDYKLVDSRVGKTILKCFCRAEDVSKILAGDCAVSFAIQSLSKETAIWSQAGAIVKREYGGSSLEGSRPRQV